VLFIADTSGIIAAYDTAAPEHGKARKLLAAGTAIISPLVLDEVDHLLTARFGGSKKERHIADMVIDDLTAADDQDRYLVPEIRSEDIRRARTVIQAHAALRLNLADAVNVVLADRYVTSQVLTLDRRDFRAITPLSHGLDAFRVLLDDA